MESARKVFRIDRVLNNNVVVAFSGDDEFIVVGKGVGFGAKYGQALDGDDPRIEKRFSLIQEENQNNFQQLFTMVPPEVMGIAEEIITFAEQSLQCSLHEHIHVALADHIGFALTRLKGGLTIENPFLEEIRTLYPDAWNVSEIGAHWIEERFGVPIPDEEIGFLTLHLHSSTHAHGLSQTVRVADAVNLAIRSIEAEIGHPIPKGELNYARMVIHLRFAIQRILRGQPIDNPLAEAIAEKLPESYEVAKRAASDVSKKIGLPFPNDEISYLALHISRFTPTATTDEI
jgi:transcriptional antiterminator